MAPKKKKGGGKAGGGSQQAKKAGDDDDWEAALNEAVAETQKAEKGPPEEKETASTEPAETSAETETPRAEKAVGEDAEAEEPAAPPLDEAAAFLASLEGPAGGGGGKGAADKKKDKKKDKKRGNKKATEDASAEDGTATKGQQQQSAKGRMIAERLAKQKAEAERLQKLKEEEERKIREEEERLEREAREAEEKRQEKLRRRAEKKAEAKKAGTYETKKQREQRLAAERRLRSMQEAGMLPSATTTTKGSSSSSGGGPANKGPASKEDDDDDDDNGAPPPPPPETKEAETTKEAVDDVATEETKAEEPPEEEEETEAEADTREAGEQQKQPEEEEEEEGDDDDWEDAADDWEASGNLSENLAKLAERARTESDADQEVDEAEAETAREKEKLRLAGLALREREEKKRQELEAQKRIEAELKEQEDRARREREALKLAARKRRLEREEANEKARSEDRLRAPICCIMGHVDTGKTKLLDKIRQTNVQDGEAGGITQQIGATYFDRPTLLEKIAPVSRFLSDERRRLSRRQGTDTNGSSDFKLSKVDAILGVDDDDESHQGADALLKLPALMVIDTPGHESFSNLRSRGSSLCDMAIVVVDLMHGLEQQTLESISMLKRKRTPFVVALNKVDRCYDWQLIENASIRESLAKQKPHTVQEFQERLTQAKVELNEQGLNVALYWENDDPRSTVSIVPTSAITGEGVPDLLRVVLSLTQERLARSLTWCATLQCTVLEVKVVEGLGATLDVILVNGTLREGDTLVLCTQDGALVSQARALLTPPPSRETRVKTELVKHDAIEAAVGLKITGQNLEKVVAGTSVLVCGPDDDLEDLKEEVVKDVSGLVQALSSTTEDKGVSVQASTLGALEALLEFLRHPGKDRAGKERPPIPVFSASVGPVHKRDVIKTSIMAQKGHDQYACILGFDVPVDPDARAHADAVGVKIFTADIIYHLETAFTRHLDDIMERKKEEARDVAVFPALFKISPKHVFNQKDPIVVGGTVVDGILKVGTPLCIPHNGFLDVGVVSSIQMNHKDVDRAKKGSECAVKIVNESNPTLTFGRQFDATHALYSKLSRASIDALKAYFKDDLSQDDWKLVIKLKKVFSII